MYHNSDGKRLVTVSAIIIAAILIVGILFSESQIQQIESQIKAAKANEVEILATRTNLRLNNAAAVLEFTSQLDGVKRPQFQEMIDPSIRGISESEDIQKREVARGILAEHSDYVRVFYLLPDGTMYMMEPYQNQKTLATDSFANRDYYQGALSTGSTYLSEGFKSAATGENVAVIALPIYSDDQPERTLVGIWAGTLNLNLISESLSKLDAGKNGRFVYVDKNGNKVADSSLEMFAKTESFAELVAVKQGLSGNSGHVEEVIDGKRMFISYHPVETLSSTWVVLLIQPYEDAFAPVLTARNQLIVMVAALSIITITFSLFIRRSYRAISNLINNLEIANTELRQKGRDLEKANAELLSIEKSKDEFISMVSHELKTPLVPIRGYSEMLLKPGLLGDLNDKQRKAANTILRSSQKVESLVQDVLDVYKLDMGKMKFAKSHVDINDIVKNVSNDLKPMISDKNIEIVLHIKTTGTVYCDPKRIEQVLSNLVKNSVDFVPERSGRIAIRVQEDDSSNSYVRFAVEDNGIGIPSEKADSLFQKFYQADTSPTRKHGGSGLGLSICKGIIEAHGGKIWIDKKYMHGACVIFTLPRKEEGTSSS